MLITLKPLICEYLRNLRTNLHSRDQRSRLYGAVVSAGVAEAFINWLSTSLATITP